MAPRTPPPDEAPPESAEPSTGDDSPVSEPTEPPPTMDVAMTAPTPTPPAASEPIPAMPSEPEQPPEPVVARWIDSMTAFVKQADGTQRVVCYGDPVIVGAHEVEARPGQLAAWSDDWSPEPELAALRAAEVAAAAEAGITLGAGPAPLSTEG